MNSSRSKPAVEKEQTHNIVNHRDYPAPLNTIDNDVYDVIVIGAGPAGLMTSASLARLGGHSVLTVDAR